MKVFEKEFRILITKKKAAQPASEDLPDVFYFYYSTSKLDWRAYAAQNDAEGKPVTKAYLVVPEKADQRIELHRRRRGLRRRQLARHERRRRRARAAGGVRGAGE